MAAEPRTAAALLQGSAAVTPSSQPLLRHLRAQARGNRLANHRLHGAVGLLSREQFHAPRTGFFPSLAATLNHILAIDGYYLDALAGVREMEANWHAFVAADTPAELAERQAASDRRLVALADALADPEAPVAMDRGDRIDHDSAARVLQHLFMHQTHHRGQAHAMLSGTPVKPPQLDEFLLASDAGLRVAELAAHGWTERQLLGDG